MQPEVSQTSQKHRGCTPGCSKYPKCPKSTGDEPQGIPNIPNVPNHRGCIPGCPKCPKSPKSTEDAPQGVPNVPKAPLDVPNVPNHRGRSPGCGSGTDQEQPRPRSPPKTRGQCRDNSRSPPAPPRVDSPGEEGRGEGRGWNLHFAGSSKASEREMKGRERMGSDSLAPSHKTSAPSLQQQLRARCGELQIYNSSESRVRGAAGSGKNEERGVPKIRG